MENLSSICGNFVCVNGNTAAAAAESRQHCTRPASSLIGFLRRIVEHRSDSESSNEPHASAAAVDDKKIC